MADEPVTRGEFDLLRSMVSSTQNRLESIDDHGTRGIASLTAQVAEIIKDVAGLQSDVTNRFDLHSRTHEQDRKDRIAARRWLIGTGLVGVGTMSAVITMLVEVLHRVHG